MENGGNHQTAGGIHSNAQVHMVEQTDGVVVQHIGVQIGVVQQGAGNSVQNDVAQSDACILAACSLQLLAVVEDCGCIEGSIVGQLRHGVQGGGHGLADRAADTAELHILVLCLVSSRRNGSSSGRSSRCFSGNCGSSHHRRIGHQLTDIPLDDAAVGAGAGCQSCVHTGRCSQLLGSGRYRSATGSSRSSSHSAALYADLAYGIQAGYFVALVKEDLQQLAFCSGLALEGSLIGLISKQHIADLDLVADLLFPAANDAAFHSDAGLRHNHCLCQSIAHSGRSSGSCSRSCCGRSFFSRCGAAATQVAAIFAGVTHGTNVYQAGNLVTFTVEDVKEGAFCSGFTFEAGLICFVGEQYITDFNSVADFLFPSTNDTAFYCNTRLGHSDCVCQVVIILSFLYPENHSPPDYLL